MVSKTPVILGCRVNKLKAVAIFMIRKDSSLIDLKAVNQHGMRLLEIKKVVNTLTLGGQNQQTYQKRIELRKQLGVEMVY